jgi:hypothetical protein
VTRSLFYLPPAERGEIEHRLDALTEVAAEWGG